MLQAAANRVLQLLYYDLSTGFSGSEKLYSYARTHGITRRQVKTFLHSQEVYTKFRQKRQKFSRVPFRISYLTEYEYADLSDLRNISQFNSGFNYLLFVCEGLSRFLWVYKLMTKSGIEMAAV